MYWNVLELKIVKCRQVRDSNQMRLYETMPSKTLGINSFLFWACKRSQWSTKKKQISLPRSFITHTHYDLAMSAGHCSMRIVSLETPLSVQLFCFQTDKQRHTHFCHYCSPVLGSVIGAPIAVGGDQSFDQSHSTTRNRFLGFSRLAGADDTNGLIDVNLLMLAHEF